MWAALRSSLPRVRMPGVGLNNALSHDSVLTAWVRGVRHHAHNAHATMKRRFRGLYGGKHIQFGNSISFSHRKCAASPTPIARGPR